MMSRVLKKVLHNCIVNRGRLLRTHALPPGAHADNSNNGTGFPTNTFLMFHALQLMFVFSRIASYATHGAGAMVLVNVMRIPCFGRRMTIGRASIIWPGAN